MSDFETHARGTAEEIRLSRALYAAIDQMREQWSDNIISPTITRAHNALYDCYMKQMEREGKQ